MWWARIILVGLALPLLTAYVGLIRYVRKHAGTWSKENSWEDDERPVIRQRYQRGVILFGLPAVIALDLLMLLMDVPFLKKQVNDYLPGKVKELLPAYKAARVFTESALESLPQFCLQLRIYFYLLESDVTNLSSFAVVEESIAISAAHFLFTWGTIAFDAWMNKRTFCGQMKHLFLLGGGHVENTIRNISNNNAGTSVDLSNMDINDANAVQLGKALAHNTTLTTLYLGSNQIGAEGAARLGEGLKEYKVLTKLDLYGNQIGDEGAAQLGEGLKENKMLTTLYLGSNQIGDEGAARLGEGLKENQTLTTLNLYGNKIGDEQKAVLRKLVANVEF